MKAHSVEGVAVRGGAGMWAAVGAYVGVLDADDKRRVNRRRNTQEGTITHQWIAVRRV